MSKNYTMADLINEYGYGFDKIEQEKQQQKAKEIAVTVPEKVAIVCKKKNRKLTDEQTTSVINKIVESLDIYNAKISQEDKENGKAILDGFKTVENLAEEILKTIKKDPEDIKITCKKCNNTFVWTVADQEFYKEKGFFKPSVCKECRKKTKVVNNFHKVD